MALKIIFAGTPEFAAKHLEALVQAKLNIIAVLTQTDKPAGRGKNILAPPVKVLANCLQLPVYQWQTLKNSQEIISLFTSLKPDVVVDVAYGLIIPKPLLSLPRYGFVNVHPSLLPRWRGPAPIQYALLSGDRETGISIMRLNEGVDTGPIYLQRKCLIQNIDTAFDLAERLIKLGCSSLIEVLNKLDELAAQPQAETGACYATKITKEMACIDWNKSAVVLDREIRAYNPWPISYTKIGNEVVRIYRAKPWMERNAHAPGEIVRMTDKEFFVATGEGLLQIQIMQFPGGKTLPVSAILNGKRHFFETHKRFV